MGFGFRKSKNFGGVRLNLSKSGLGVSYGVKGFRISTNSKGSTLYAGRNGFYYRKKISGNNSSEKNSTNNSECNNLEQRETFSSYFHILKDVQGDFQYYIDKKEEWTTKELQLLGKNPFGCLFFILLFLGVFFAPIFLATIIVGFYFWYKKLKLKIKIDSSSKLLDYANQFNNLSDNTILHNASTLEELQYGICKTSNICEQYLPFINLKDYKLLFIENGIVFYNSDDIFLLPYSELELNLTETTSNMVEPPSYAEIIESTYEHVNKDGSPSKRYKENRKVSKIKTWVIELSSGDNIFIPLAFFDKKMSLECFEILNKIRQQDYI